MIPNAIADFKQFITATVLVTRISVLFAVYRLDLLTRITMIYVTFADSFSAVNFTIADILMKTSTECVIIVMFPCVCWEYRQCIGTETETVLVMSADM